jgi:hypothetical protein
MCTHLHWDHVGWNTQLVDGEWVPTFPNAQYVMAKREYDHWDAVYAKEKNNGSHAHALAFEDSVLPLMRADKAVLVEDDFELDHGISLEPRHGRTPGHVIMNVASNGQQASCSATSSTIRCRSCFRICPPAPTRTWTRRASPAVR